jgi:hypothetical protein
MDRLLCEFNREGLAGTKKGSDFISTWRMDINIALPLRAILNLLVPLKSKQFLNNYPQQDLLSKARSVVLL